MLRRNDYWMCCYGDIVSNGLTQEEFNWLSEDWSRLICAFPWWSVEGEFPGGRYSLSSLSSGGLGSDEGLKILRHYLIEEDVKPMEVEWV